MKSESYSDFVNRLGTFATGLFLLSPALGRIVDQAAVTKEIPETYIGLGLLGLALVGVSLLPSRKKDK